MPISIKSEETEALTRKLAELTGESLTEALRVAVSERYERLKRARRNSQSLIEELNEITLRFSQRPRVSNMTGDEILGYDEFGIPAK